MDIIVKCVCSIVQLQYTVQIRFTEGSGKMRDVYLDNAATSFPKAPGVGEAIKNFVEKSATNINRSGYNVGFTAEELVFETREMICDLVNFTKTENIIFTVNATTGLNILIKGVLKPGDHCLVSSVEHNAVMRPLNQISQIGVECTRIPCDSKGKLDVATIPKLIKSNTKAIIMTHASNVTGTILPLKEVGQICAKSDLYFIVDGSQTLGSLPINFTDAGIHALAFTGHKSLLGPQGIGGFVVSPILADKIEPLICGGTGSLSEREEQPMILPDKFEAGTINLPGIAGLHQALKFIMQTGIDAIRLHELELTQALLGGLKALPNIRIIGSSEMKERTSLISIDCLKHDNADVAYTLQKEYGIRTRCGLHCAPAAHKTVDTFPQGTIRFSPGYFNTKKEMDYTISSLQKILTEPL